MSTVIEDVIARRVFNSRGEETLEVDVVTATGFGRASAPSGASRGKSEIVPYPKRGVDQAIREIEENIASELIGMDAEEQSEIDSLLHEIDGTNNFRIIGGNTAYAISLAVADAAADSYGLPLFQHLAGYFTSELPFPLGNVLSGGLHARGKTPNIQEFLVLPVGASSFLEAAMANVLVHQRVGILLKKKNRSFVGGRSDEGAWTCVLDDEDAFNIVSEACDEVSSELGFECRMGVDVAASTFWNSKEKCYVYSSGKRRDSEEQLGFVLDLIEKYHLVYVEDPFHEEDFKSFAKLTKKVRGHCLICGDDLFVTHIKRLTQGIKIGAANSIIIKVNQVGTLTDAWETTKTALENGYVPVVSHRSGDTEHTHIAHLAVAFHAPIIKTGVVEGARISKLNELIRIEEILGSRAEMSRLPF